MRRWWGEGRVKKGSGMVVGGEGERGGRYNVGRRWEGREGWRKVHRGCFVSSPWRPHIEDKRMVLEHTHGLFIT